MTSEAEVAWYKQQFKEKDVKIATNDMMGYNVMGCVLTDDFSGHTEGIVAGAWRNEDGNIIQDAEGQIFNALFERNKAEGKHDYDPYADDDTIMVNQERRVVITCQKKYIPRWEKEGFVVYQPEHGITVFPNRYTRDYIVKQIREGFEYDDC